MTGTANLKIARIATIPFFLYNHLRDQVAATAAAGHEVVLISSGGEEAETLRAIPGVRFKEIDIPRKISPLRDLRALWQLFLFFRRERFDIVHSTTPKAGMLCGIAGFLARVPVRLHTFTGQPWVELRGMVGFAARAGDWLTGHLDTFCYADSLSQRDFLVAEGICRADRIRVPGAGSLAGVDLARFDPGKWAATKDRTLHDLGIPAGCRVITFIGRLTRDKGINELLEAFRAISQHDTQCVLLLVGPGEDEDGTIRKNVRRKSDARVRAIGYSAEPERYLAVSDIFCLPSYREGFGNVVIEAAAMGVPSVGTSIVGLRDAIVDGETGLLVPPKDSASLARTIEALLADDARRQDMGRKARERAVSLFDARNINAAVLNEYHEVWHTRFRLKPVR
jgi:glycosyltransferase involved in cell wall biosynthesis